MKNYKIYTLALLLFTFYTLTSCVKTPTKTKVTDKTTQDVKKTTTIKRVNAAGFKAEVNGKKVQLIDVRTPGEYTQGHIENAININIYAKDFVTKTNSLDKSKPVYVYCRSGARSMKAANNLKSRGYNVVNLNGGIGGWMRNGFKVVK
jgi:rhodanese-related sulfurtransferase